MGYKGYSLIGSRELNKFWQEQTEINAQKDLLEREIKNDLIEIKYRLETYLRHSYALHHLTKQHQEIRMRMINHFDGKAKVALTGRLTSNELRMIELNKRFDSFVDEVSTIFSMKSK